MQSSDSSTLPRQLRLLGFLPWPGTALAIAGETRSPRFRRAPFVRDVAIDPGRASAPRIAVPHILPSTMCTASAPTLSQISWLIPAADLLGQRSIGRDDPALLAQFDCQ